MIEQWNAVWEGVLLVEGEVSPTGRYAEPGAIKLPKTPLPLTDLNGNVVGRVDEVWRDGNKIKGRGICDGSLADTPPIYSSAVRVKSSETIMGQQVVTSGEIGSVAAVPPPWTPR